jgi:hypothetical protein
VKLGKREVDALTCPPERRDCLVFDEDLTGFGLRVTRKGTKTFLFQYHRGALVRRLRLGRYGDITPAQARRLAEAARGKVAAGRDPAAEHAAAIEADAEAARQRKRQAAADALTLERLIECWEEQHLAHRAERYRAEAVRALRRGFGTLLASPAAAIGTADVRRVLDAIPRPRVPPAGKADRTGAGQDRGVLARRIRAYGRACFAWAVKRELVPANPFASVSLESQEVARERVLSDAELGEAWRAAGALGWPWGPYLRFLMLTLQREAETAGMCWAELSPDLATWELPGARTKNRRPHIVHLAEPARAILRAVPRVDGSPLVFTTTGVTPISGFSHAKARLFVAIEGERAKAAEKAGHEPAPLAPWRLHDFRRTGVTVLARQGVRWEVADKLLNHAHGAIRGVAAVYQRHEFFAERQAALELWAAHIVAIAGCDPNERLVRPARARGSSA